VSVRGSTVTGPPSVSRAVAVLSAAAGAMAVVGSYAIPLITSVPTEGQVIGVIVVGLLVVGGVLAARRPGNVVCWLVLIAGVVWSVLAFTSIYARYGLEVAPVPGATLAYWLATWLWIPGLVILPVFVPPLFPDGRPLSRRWGAVVLVGVGGLALVLLAQWTVEWGPSGYAYEWAPSGLSNPLHLALLDGPREALFAIGGVSLLAAALGGFVSAFQRYRVSRGMERQQLRWVVFGVTGGLAVYALTVLVEVWLGGDQRVTDLGIGLALLSFPVSIAVAVLRYRLYDLDRIVSRTVSYGAVLLVLGGVYAGGVVTLSTVLGSFTGGGGGDLAVAGSTLAVAALFRPVTGRVRLVVDRRFNRSRLDAVRTVERFSQRLRDEVELEVVGRELVGSAVVAVQPRSAHIWVPPRFRNASGTVGVHDGTVTPEARG
jgi:hypothetical protein